MAEIAQGIETDEYYTVVSTIEEPMINLVDQMRANLESGDYDLLLGDDTSGRLPTLVFRNVVKDIYGKRGSTEPKTAFVQGGRNVKGEELLRQLVALQGRYQQGDGKKILLVTEYISSGGSLKRITDHLKNNGLGFDVATTYVNGSYPDGTDYAQIYKKDLELPEGTNVFIGEVAPYGEPPPIYRKASLTGLHPATNWNPYVFALRLDRYTSQDAIDARHDVKVLSQKIINHLAE